MRLLSPVAVILSAPLLLASSGLATTVVVPDDHPTIQAALGSGADTVLVRSGSYPEDVSIDRPVALLAFDRAPMGAVPPVSVARLTFGAPTATGLARVQGIDVMGPTSLVNPSAPTELSVALEKCRFKAGIVQPGLGRVGPLSVRLSVVNGGVAATPRTAEFESNVMAGGGISVRCESSASFRANSIMGPASAGIETNGEFGGLLIERNELSGLYEGIVVLDPFGTRLTENEISHCDGAAIRFTQTPDSEPRLLGTSVVTVAFNSIRNCEGPGLEISSSGGVFDVHENLIQTVGGAGIHASGWAYMHVDRNEIRESQGPGVWLQGDAYGEGVGENRIFDGGADGMLLETGSAVGRNIVGRCAGNGLVFGPSGGSAGGNTLFFNGSSGIEIRGPASVYNNIGYGNGRYGLISTASEPPSLGCNDWAANIAGATQGVAPDPTDLFVEPLFCDLSHDDAHLNASSPLLDAPGCGLVGALDQGCAKPTAVIPGSGPARLGLSALPRPARDRVRLAWDGVEGPARIEIYDVTGALRWQAAVEQESGRIEWLRRDREGNELPPGLYFVRLVNRNRVSRAVIVTVR